MPLKSVRPRCFPLSDFVLLKQTDYSEYAQHLFLMSYLLLKKLLLYFLHLFSQ